MSKRTYSILEIHRLYGMDPERARRWCRRGRWTAKKIDGEWYVLASDVEKTFDFDSAAEPLGRSAESALDRAAGLIQ